MPTFGEGSQILSHLMHNALLCFLVLHNYTAGDGHGNLLYLAEKCSGVKNEAIWPIFVLQNLNFSESSAAPEGSPPPIQQTNIRMLNSWVAASTRFSQTGEEKPGNMSHQSEHIYVRGFPRKMFMMMRIFWTWCMDTVFYVCLLSSLTNCPFSAADCR